MNDEVSAKVRRSIQNWVGGVVIAALPLGFAGIVGAWVELQRVVGLLEHHGAAIAKNTEFRVEGKRFVLDRGERLERRVEAQGELDQQHYQEAERWKQRILSNEENIRRILDGNGNR